LHSAKKYDICRDEECKKWDQLYNEADKIHQYCDPVIQKVNNLASYLEDIAKTEGIRTKSNIIQDSKDLK
jgi:hypothetical protein